MEKINKINDYLKMNAKVHKYQKPIFNKSMSIFDLEKKAGCNKERKWASPEFSLNLIKRELVERDESVLD